MPSSSPPGAPQACSASSCFISSQDLAVGSCRVTKEPRWGSHVRLSCLSLPSGWDDGCAWLRRISPTLRYNLWNKNIHKLCWVYEDHDKNMQMKWIDALGGEDPDLRLGRRQTSRRTNVTCGTCAVVDGVFTACGPLRSSRLLSQGDMSQIAVSCLSGDAVDRGHLSQAVSGRFVNGAPQNRRTGGGGKGSAGDPKIPGHRGHLHPGACPGVRATAAPHSLPVLRASRCVVGVSFR